MISKLGFHIIREIGGQFDKLSNCKNKLSIVKVLDDTGLLNRLHNALGNQTTYIGRTFKLGDNFQGYLGSRDPKEAAKVWMDVIRPMMNEAKFAYWESFNEPPTDPDTMAKYGAFEAERQRLMHLEGFKACIGQFSVGSPPLENWKYFYPALDAADRYGNILGVHEYGALWMDTYYGPNSLQALQEGRRVPSPAEYVEGWLMCLYRRVYSQHLVPNGWTNVRIAITETGLMSLAPREICDLAGYNVGSWKTCREAWSRLSNRPDTEQYYVEQLQWFDRQMQKDPYMVGATIFTWGSYPDSEWVVDEIDGAVADKLVQYIQVQVPEPPPIVENKMRTLVIDVSAHQGNALDWKRIATEPSSHGLVKAAILRYSVGTGKTADSGKDVTFDRNYAEARQNGLPVGAYHYMWYGDDRLQDQINLFCSLDPSKLQLPMALDVEDNRITAAQVQIFLREIERITGRVPIIYTRKDIWQSIMGTSPNHWSNKYRLWVAQYPAVVGDHPTILPAQWTNWTIWQFSSSGSVPGHAGNIDMNYYNGSLEDMMCDFRLPSPEEFPMRWPVNSTRVTQEFGENPNYYGPLLGAPGMGHEGGDFAGALGDPIWACADGVISERYFDGSYGNLVVIDHQNGFKSLYAHMSKLSTLNIGARVKAGDKIGEVGTTGASTGTHLHLTLYHSHAEGISVYPKKSRGYIINPTPYLLSPLPSEEGVRMRMKYTSDINIRSGPSVGSTDIGDIPAGAIVTAYPPAIGEYLGVTYNSIRGYALARHFELPVNITPRPTMTTVLNIRTTPEVTATNDIGDIRPGEVLLGWPTSGTWWQVKQGSLEGWALSEWLQLA